MWDPKAIRKIFNGAGNHIFGLRAWIIEGILYAFLYKSTIVLSLFLNIYLNSAGWVFFIGTNLHYKFLV
ncbi:unnamed protein product [Blepharisma stoltei]|uniref:Uncharacterized protein n=1 Tax=Blepharisma stoltei TaxID=1481888 RepID=A0AAU9J8S5_9CILI|nr:unnamed protein product [Blepharisma stoltei]